MIPHETICTDESLLAVIERENLPDADIVEDEVYPTWREIAQERDYAKPS